MKKIVVSLFALLTMTVGLFADVKWSAGDLKNEKKVTELAEKAGIPISIDGIDEDGATERLYLADEENWIIVYINGDEEEKEDTYFFAAARIDGKFESNLTYKTCIEGSKIYLGATINEGSKSIISNSADMHTGYADWGDKDGVFYYMCRVRVNLYYNLLYNFLSSKLEEDPAASDKYDYFYNWFKENKEASAKDFIKEHNKYLKEQKK